MSSRWLRNVAHPYWWLAAGALWGARTLVRRRGRLVLAGKNALVTGGSRGLGLEIARLLVQKGAHVALVARDAEELERARTLLSERAPAGARIVTETCDLRVAASIEAMLVRVKARLGPIDVLVNNAGMIQVGPLDSMSRVDFEEAMQLHYYAPLELMLRVRAAMRRLGSGRIVNVASVGGVVSVPHLLPYAGSKFALVGLSRGMASELAPDGIRVTTVVPGLMRTGSPRKAYFKGDHEKEYAWFKLADSLPGLSVSARYAARRIVRAIEYGDPEVVLGLPARLAELATGVVPEAVAMVLAIVQRLLPKGNDHARFTGAESESKLVPRVLTLLTDRAAVRNNEI
jgi:NAD(P)-dependent dehydrogenase (short-subunit alcohol dehydrogenase family)